MDDKDDLRDQFHEEVFEALTEQEKIAIELNVKRHVDKEVKKLKDEKAMEDLTLKITRQEITDNDFSSKEGQKSNNQNHGISEENYKKAKALIEEARKKKTWDKKDLSTIYFNICFKCRRKGHLKKDCPF